MYTWSVSQDTFSPSSGSPLAPMSWKGRLSFTVSVSSSPVTMTLAQATWFTSSARPLTHTVAGEKRKSS